MKMDVLLGVLSLVGGCDTCEYQEPKQDGFCYLHQERPDNYNCHKPRRLGVDDIINMADEFNKTEGGENGKG